MGKRAEALELAVLGLLHDAPMHGYELRKQVNALLGWGRAFSYGTLYPCLKELVHRGFLAEDSPGEAAAAHLGGRRSKIVYKLTPEGKERFADLLAQAGPSSWDDEQFGVHFAFFARADAATRMRILEGRRTRLQERLEQFRSALQRTRERLDAYTLELQSHGLESVEREVRWLDQLIAVERRGDDRAERSPRRVVRAQGDESAEEQGLDRRGDEPTATENPARAPRRGTAFRQGAGALPSRPAE
ncbi:MAG: PadR family transcriptional regulator [Jiangellaceae bacterium]